MHLLNSRHQFSRETYPRAPQYWLVYPTFGPRHVPGCYSITLRVLLYCCSELSLSLDMFSLVNVRFMALHICQISLEYVQGKLAGSVFYVSHRMWRRAFPKISSVTNCRFSTVLQPRHWLTRTDKSSFLRFRVFPNLSRQRFLIFTIDPAQLKFL